MERSKFARTGKPEAVASLLAGTEREVHMEALAKTPTRSCSRSPLTLRVVVLHGNSEERPGMVRDISFGGAFLETDAQNFRPNDVVTLCFELKGSNSPHIYSLTGTVARLERTGAGIAFDDFDSANVLALRDVYRHLLI